MLSTAVNGYAAAAVARVLQALDGRTQYSFRADLLDLDNMLLFSLDGLQQEGSITHDTQQPMKRGAELHFLATARNDQHSAPLGTFAATVAAQSRLFWLRCGEASGNLADSSGNSRTFTAMGTPTYGVGSLVPGDLTNNAIGFSGDDFFTITDAAWMDVSAISLIIAYRGITANSCLIDRDDGATHRHWRLEIDATGQVAFSINFTSGSYTTFTAIGAVNDGGAHLIHAMYGAGYVQIYVDGKRLLKTAETRTMLTGTLAIDIGFTNAGTHAAVATLDEVGMLNRALSAKEIRDEYQAWSAQTNEILIDRDRGDRVKIYAGVKMPTAGTDGNYIAEWPQIVAVLTSPQEDYSPTGITIQITCQDQTRILQDAAFASVTTLLSGANYITGTNGVLAIAAAAGFDTSGWSVTSTALTAPADVPFEIASTYLDAINYLLTAINYKPIRFNGNGAGILEPNKLDKDLPLSDTIDSTTTRVIGAERLSSRLEPRKVINSVIVANGNPDVPPVIGVGNNVAVRSASSTVWNAPKVLVFQIDAPDSTTATAIAGQVLSDTTAKLARRVVFDTLLRPFHDDRDRIHLTIPEIRINSDFVEESWTLPLDPTQLMSHVFLDVVDLT